MARRSEIETRGWYCPVGFLEGRFGGVEGTGRSARGCGKLFKTDEGEGTGVGVRDHGGERSV
jgi:hypothetical protein